MCVLTYVPVESGGFVVTSNRDENIIRSKAKPPKKLKVKGIEVFCPVDPSSGGTWIATSKKHTLVLLNGGYKKHISQPPYRQSRGKVIMDFFCWNDADLFLKNFEFDQMEPFTLLIFENENHTEITEIKWCSNSVFMNKLEGKEPLIWSSATLYDQEAMDKRASWFMHYLTNVSKENTPDDILEFHENGGSWDAKDSINLNRDNGIKTVSITQIEVNHDTKRISYIDMQSHSKKRFLVL